MIGRAGRPQFDREATAVIMTRFQDKNRYQSLVGGSEPLQSYLHKRLTENLNSEAALHTVTDVAQCVQWLRSTFLYVRAAKDPKRYLGVSAEAPPHLISKKIEELCVKAMNGLASSGLITMDDACCIESTIAGRLMSIYYLDFETMKLIMKIEGTESLERLLWIICESHELSDMHLRVDERRYLNSLNRNNNSTTIRFPMKGKISTRQMKLNCVIQAILGCLQITDPSLYQESQKILRIAERISKCMIAYVTREESVQEQPQCFTAAYNSIILKKCISAQLWENSPFVSKQLKGIGQAFSTLLATAGKTTFTILEESHPRDLERIMNKGPPAGNVLRKQISLLPKYEVTMTPIDEKTVTVQLRLINLNYLAENIEHLTAGENHQSYVIVGDSENHILVLKSFTDKNLINLYEGVMSFSINRKHPFEHNIFAHCLSSCYVGIDSQTEYLFKSLLPLYNQPKNNTMHQSEISKPNTSKQSKLTDVFKEKKKRVDTNKKETVKKKKEHSLIDKLAVLKESFNNTTKDLQAEMKRSLNKYVSKENLFEENIRDNINPTQSRYFENSDFINLDELEKNDSVIDKSRIDDILTEIENEITDTGLGSEISEGCNSLTNGGIVCKSTSNTLKKNNNYTFIDLLDKNVSFDDDDEAYKNCENDLPTNGFSEITKQHINKFIEQANKVAPTNEYYINEILGMQNENAITNDIDKIPINSLPKFDENTNETISKSNQSLINNPFNSIDDIDKENIYFQEDFSESKSTISKTIAKNDCNENIKLNIQDLQKCVSHLSDSVYLEPNKSIQEMSKNSTQKGNEAYLPTFDNFDENANQNNKTFSQTFQATNNSSFEIIDDKNQQIKQNLNKDLIIYLDPKIPKLHKDYSMLTKDLKHDDINNVIEVNKNNDKNNSSSSNTVFSNDDSVAMYHNQLVNEYNIDELTTDFSNELQNEELLKVTDRTVNKNEYKHCDKTHSQTSQSTIYNKIYSLQNTQIESISTINKDTKFSLKIIKNVKIDLNVMKINTAPTRVNDLHTNKDVKQSVIEHSPTKRKHLSEYKNNKLIKWEKPDISKNESNFGESSDELRHKPAQLYKEVCSDDHNNMSNDVTNVNREMLDINDILKKYSQVLKTSVQPIKCEVKQETPFKKIKIQKSGTKRPFKISEINRIDFAAYRPSEILDISQKVSHPTYSRPIKTTQQSLGQFTYPQYIETKEENTKEESDVRMALNNVLSDGENDIELPSGKSSQSDDELESIVGKNVQNEITDISNTDDDTDFGFGIDQTLFDPKTVLQCIQENCPPVIPPPIEFRDNDFNFENRNQDEDVTESQNLCNNIFNTNDCEIFTSLKESETWTSTDENDDIENEIIQPGYKSITVVRNPMRNDIGVLKNLTQDRKSKLSRFKHPLKSQYKVKRNIYE